MIDDFQFPTEPDMNKHIPLFLLLILLTGVWSAAGAFGKRAEHSAQPTFHLVEEKTIATFRPVLSFQGDRPHVVSVDDTLIFLGGSGKEKTRFEKARYARLFWSQDRKFAGLQEISNPQATDQTEKRISFTLLDHQGSRLWSWQNTLGRDELIPSFYISNRGRVAVVEPLKGELIFLNEEGSPERIIELFPDAIPEMERPVACAFTADGARLAVNALFRHPRPGDDMTPREKGQSFLILFDDDGEELWRRQLEREISDQVAISPGGETIAAGAFTPKGVDVVERTTYFYDHDGELLSELELPYRLALFATDGTRFLMAQKSDLRMVSTATGKVLWENRLPAEHGQIRAVDLSPDGSLTLVKTAPGKYHSGRFYYAPAHAALFDEEGEQIWTASYPEDTFDQPAAHFLPDGSKFLLAFQNRYLIYERDK
jgi:hypothetical protein